MGPSVNLVHALLASGHQKLLAMRQMYSPGFGDIKALAESESQCLKYTDYLEETFEK